MALPDSRDFTAINGTSTLPAATLNSIQDAIVALVARFRRETYRDGADDASTPVGTTTLAKDPAYTNLTIGAGVTVKTDGFAIYATGTVDIAGTLDGSGKNAAAGGGCTGPHGQSGAFGVVASAQSALPWDIVGLGGSGGYGGTTGGVAGGAGGIVHAPASLDYEFPPFRYSAVPQNNLVYPGYAGALDFLRGGGGGGSGGGNFSPGYTGGGGGAGGALVVIIAKSIILRSTANLWSNGGNGSNGGTDSGGGGGGGGGAFLFVCESFDDQGASYQASQGTYGFGNGAGANGSAGSVGNTTPYVVLLDAWS